MQGKAGIGALIDPVHTNKLAPTAHQDYFAKRDLDDVFQDRQMIVLRHQDPVDGANLRFEMKGSVDLINGHSDHDIFISPLQRRNIILRIFRTSSLRYLSSSSMRMAVMFWKASKSLESTT